MAGNDNNVNAQTSNGTSTAWQIVGRLIAAAIILVSIYNLFSLWLNSNIVQSIRLITEE